MINCEIRKKNKCCAASNNLSTMMEIYDSVKGNGSYALAYFNIKNFRYFNTKYGNESGDEILTLILNKFETLLVDEECVVRFYADHFIALFHYEIIEELYQERIVEMVDRLYRIDDERIYRELFWSIGVYELADASVSFSDALNLANLTRKSCDTLLARNTCIDLFSKEIYDRYMDQMDLETATANAYKNYEFVTFLQPKVDLNTGKIVGAEALLRWFDQDGKMIPLYKFLPILNENGYIALVDLDIFDQACKMLEERLSSNKKVVPVSFNLSKSYFYDQDPLKDYREVFEKYQIPKDLIEIELMESISLDDTVRLKEIISQFSSYGFHCSLDDFGNGYSSFNVLLNATLSYVKMDRQFFLQNLKGDSKLIIRTIIEMIHSLGMKVVAEGVELQEHIDWLKECRCDLVQGYYYYKPMPIKEFELLLDSEEHQ